MTTLVTGGLGFLGAPLVQALVARGTKVRILDDASRGRTDRLAGVDVEIVSGDVRDGAVVHAATRGVDTVLHLAFINGTQFFYEKPKLVLDVGVRGMLNVLDACVAHGVPTLVVASSSEVYQTPPHIPTDETVALSVPDVWNPRYSYGGGKIISELLAVNWSSEHFERMMIFRPHNIYGPDMGGEHVIPQLVDKLRRSRDIELQGDGRETRAFCFVEDFVAGVMVVLEHGAHRNIYNIGTQEEVEIADLARRIARRMEIDARITPGPPAAGGTRRRCPDIAKLAALGYRPRWKLDDGLAPTVDWYAR
jgi:nucleoside-diphosphate-sugar epimerase